MDVEVYDLNNILKFVHTWCEDGYSIELGNDVLSVDRNGLKNDCSQRRPPHCRSFNERKQLLIDVGGYTEKELKEYLGCPHRRQWRATNAATRDANIRAAATTTCADAAAECCCFLLLFVVVLPYFYL